MMFIKQLQGLRNCNDWFYYQVQSNKIEEKNLKKYLQSRTATIQKAFTEIEFCKGLKYSFLLYHCTTYAATTPNRVISMPLNILARFMSFEVRYSLILGSTTIRHK